MRAFVLFAVTACAWSQVVLTSGTAVVIDSREPVALQKAARDLASDLAKVFGSPVRVVEHGGEGSLCVSLVHNLPADVQRPAGSEVLHIRTAP
jgi:hypothetical protein